MENRLSFGSVLHAVKKLCVLNACFLAFMTLFRVLFFFYFSGPAPVQGRSGYIFQAFFLGMRFDLSILAYLNLLVTLTLLAVWAIGRASVFAAWVTTLRYYYTAMFSFILVVMAVDFGFFSYFKDHINVLIYGFAKDDTRALITTIIQNRQFVFVAAILAVLIVLIDLGARTTARSILRHHLDRGFAGNAWLKIGFVGFLLCANGLAARGSLRMFPLSPIYAEISPDPFINKLSVNGVSALAETIGFGMENRKNDFDLAKRYGYAGNMAQAFADFLNVPLERIDRANLLENLRRRTGINPAAAKIKPNVVVVIMESMGANLLRYDAPGFDLLGSFRTHAESDYMFRNFLPAGLVSVHALESIVLNLPQRPFDLSVTQTPAAYTCFPTAAALPYKQAGYESVVVYGGSLKWRGLDTFLCAQGFDRIIGEGGLASGEKNQWGVYDQYLFDAAYQELAAAGKRKFILIMTTTNHPPYSVPASYTPAPLAIPGRLAQVMTSDRDLAQKRFTTFQYANEQLGKFITAIKKSPLGENTIIAVTGDHNFWDVFNYSQEETFFRYSVPLYLYLPAALKPSRVDTSVCGSHMDIMPTLYGRSLSDTAYYAAGNDLLSGNSAAINGEGFVMTNEAAACHPYAGGQSSYYRWNPAEPGMLVAAAASAAQQQLLTRYQAAVTVADYVIRTSGAIDRRPCAD